MSMVAEKFCTSGSLSVILVQNVREGGSVRVKYSRALVNYVELLFRKESINEIR